MANLSCTTAPIPALLEASSLGLRKLEAKFYGFNQPYAEINHIMHSLHQQLAQDRSGTQANNHLMFLEHAPVITYTRSHNTKSFVSAPKDIKQAAIDVALADRGGDATFHGPGQLVGYPIFKLECDLVSYIRKLELALLRAMHNLGLNQAVLLRGHTGIWVKTADPSNPLGASKTLRLRKLIAIGVGVANSVSRHGFALNININYQRYTKHIIPCGLKDLGVINLAEALELDGLFVPDYSAILKIISQSIACEFDFYLSQEPEIGDTQELNHG